MLHDKATTKISELQTTFSSSRLDSAAIMQEFKALKLSASFSEFNHLKQAGYSFKLVLSLLIWMVSHSHKTLNSSLAELGDQGIRLKKDVYYRLKNNAAVCWHRIHWYIVMRFLAATARGSANSSATAPEKEGATSTATACVRKKYRCLI